MTRSPHFPFLASGLLLLAAALAGCASAPAAAPAPAAPAAAPGSPPPAGVPAPALPQGHPPLGGPGTTLGQARAYDAFLRGQMLAADGKAAEALSAYEEAARLDPASQELQSTLAAAALAARDLDRAERAARRLVELSPSDPSPRLLLGEVLAGKGEFPGAGAEYRKAVELGSREPRAYLFLAGVYEREGDLPRAQQTLEQLIAISDKNGMAHFYLGRFLASGDKMDQAAREFARAAEDNPALAAGLGQAAKEFVDKGQPGKAVRLLSARLAIDPADSRARLMLGDALAADGKPDEGKREMEAVLAAEPANTAALVSLALLSVEGKDLPAALGYLTRAREAEPGNLDMWMEVGTLQARVGSKEAGLATYREAAKRFPDRFEPLGGAALLLEGMGRKDEALDTVRQGIARAPDRSSARVFAAQLLAEMGRPAEAESTLAAGLAQTPDDPLLLYQAGVLYEQTGRWPKAEEAMQRILKGNPDHFEALNFLGYSWADRGERLTEAEEMVKRALALSSGASHITDSLGWVYYRQGRYKEALVQLLEAASKMPEDATVLDHVGDCYLKLGEKAKAVEYWKASLKADPKRSKVADKLRSAGEVVP